MSSTDGFESKEAAERAAELAEAADVAAAQADRERAALLDEMSARTRTWLRCTR